MKLSLPYQNMRSRIHWNWSLGLALAVLPFLGAHTQQSLSETTDSAPFTPQPTNSTPDLFGVTNPAPALLPEPTAPSAAPTAPAEPPAQAMVPDAAPPDQPVADDLANAPVAPVTAEKPLPPNLRLTAPATEVVKLANSGLDETVMLAFVTNSMSTFNLGAEDIIYLNDIGVPGAVVSAMIQRDQALKQLGANAAPAPAAPPPAEQPAAPTPAEAAPQTAPPAEPYTTSEAAAYPVFYDALAPYGTWVDVGGYGLCWQPTVVVVNAGWRPYCNGGRWLYTDCGWYWMSNYSWGWAPFHYGRWFCHSRFGWCWAPGNVWGPSWVCWRYNGNYCGWAPLPPAAGFTAGIGLTYHGRGVNSSFTFGLGASAFSFVAAGDFTSHRLDRCAVPAHRATQIYHQTVSSAAIEGSHSRIVNHGIPATHLTTATRSQMRPLSIRGVTSPTALSDRHEQFDRNNRNLTVYRPHFRPGNTTAPATRVRSPQGFGGGSRPGTQLNSGRSAFAPVPTTPAAAPAPSPRTPGAASPTRSGSSSRSRWGPQSSLADPSSAAVPATAPTPTVDRSPSAPARKSAPPLILRGSDRSRQTIGRSSTTTTHSAAPSSSYVIIGRRESTQRQTLSQPSAPVPENSRPQPPAPQQNIISRPGTRQAPQALRGAEAQAQVPSQSHWSTPRATMRSSHNEQPRSFAAPPSHSAPVQVPRVAPAPAPAPSTAHSYSSPSSPSATRMGTDSPRSSHSSFSHPGGRSSSGSDRNPR